MFTKRDFPKGERFMGFFSRGQDKPTSLQIRNNRDVRPPKLQALASARDQMNVAYLKAFPNNAPYGSKEWLLEESHSIGLAATIAQQRQASEAECDCKTFHRFGCPSSRRLP